MNTDIILYNKAQEPQSRMICNLLAQEITEALLLAKGKVWHGGPVWFIDDNPVVGYWVRKTGVQLLFWSGQTFNEPGLKDEGSFKAAEARYVDVNEINRDDLHRWLKKAETIQWDYKNIIKNKGHLNRIR